MSNCVLIPTWTRTTYHAQVRIIYTAQRSNDDYLVSPIIYSARRIPPPRPAPLLPPPPEWWNDGLAEAACRQMKVNESDRAAAYPDISEDPVVVSSRLGQRESLPTAIAPRGEVIGEAGTFW